MARIQADIPDILDIDGTIVASNDQHALAFIEAAREMEIATPEFATSVTIPVAPPFPPSD
jgi:beta-phosphoglucomutase-like phosphatase (HAD superfamily)